MGVQVPVQAQVPVPVQVYNPLSTFSRLHVCLRLIQSIQLGYKIVNYLVELFANDAASYSYISSSDFRKC